MRARTIFLTLAVALALPGTAAASVTVAHDGSTTTVIGDADADAVTVEYTYFGSAPVSGDGLRIANSAGVVPGPGCVPEGSGSVVCPVGTALDADLGGGGDGFSFPDSDYVSVRTDVAGEGGNDTLNGTYSGALDGGDGDDTLQPLGYGDQRIAGGGGSDTVELTGYGGYVTIGGGDASYGTQVAPDVERVRGGLGDDYIYVAPGAGGGHDIAGGGGFDLLSYAAMSDPVTVTVGGSGTDTVAGDVESVTGGQGDDVLKGGGASGALSGGGGNDTLTAGGGDDRLSGGDGNDRLEGGSGEDSLAGGDGGDVLRGGADKDTVSYYAYEDPYYGGEFSTGFAYEPRDHEPAADEDVPGVTITLDDRANDGTTGEGDDVGADIELITGSAGDDTITGGPGDNEIAGGSGKDRIDGADGADKVSGGLGDDIVTGGAGDDEVRGGSDSDQLDGGPGRDLVIGHEEDDTVAGVDVVEVRDGEADAVACQGGLSRVLADQHDVVDPKCALVERFTLGPPGSPPPPPVGPSPLLRVHLKGTVVRRGVARIRSTCAPAPVPCAGRMTLFTLHKRKLRRLGRTDFAVPAGRTRVVNVKLSKLGRRLANRRRGVRTQVFVAHQSPDAKPVRIATVGLRRAGRR